MPGERWLASTVAHQVSARGNLGFRRQCGVLCLPATIPECFSQSSLRRAFRLPMALDLIRAAVKVAECCDGPVAITLSVDSHLTGCADAELRTSHHPNQGTERHTKVIENNVNQRRRRDADRQAEIASLQLRGHNED